MTDARSLRISDANFAVLWVTVCHLSCDDDIILPFLLNNVFFSNWNLESAPDEFRNGTRTSAKVSGGGGMAAVWTDGRTEGRTDGRPP